MMDIEGFITCLDTLRRCRWLRHTTLYKVIRSEETIRTLWKTLLTLIAVGILYHGELRYDR